MNYYYTHTSLLWCYMGKKYLYFSQCWAIQMWTQRENRLWSLILIFLIPLIHRSLEILGIVTEQDFSKSLNNGFSLYCKRGRILLILYRRIDVFLWTSTVSSLLPSMGAELDCLLSTIRNSTINNHRKAAALRMERFGFFFFKKEKKKGWGGEGEPHTTHTTEQITAL